MKFLLIFLLTLCLYAGNDGKKEHHINKDLTYLSLSPEQNEALKKTLKKFQHEIEEFRELKEKINAQKQALFLQETLDIDTLNKLNQELYEKATKEESKVLLRLHEFLTKEQRAQFIRYFEEWEVR